MPPAPVRDSTAPSARVFPALFPPLGVAVPVVVLLLQAERRRVQTTSSDAALRPQFRSTLPPISAYGTDFGARKSTQVRGPRPDGRSGPARRTRSSAAGRRACRAGAFRPPGAAVQQAGGVALRRGPLGAVPGAGAAS